MFCLLCLLHQNSSNQRNQHSSWIPCLKQQGNVGATKGGSNIILKKVPGKSFEHLPASPSNSWTYMVLNFWQKWALTVGYAELRKGRPAVLMLLTISRLISLIKLANLQMGSINYKPFLAGMDDLALINMEPSLNSMPIANLQYKKTHTLWNTPSRIFLCHFYGRYIDQA